MRKLSKVRKVSTNSVRRRSSTDLISLRRSSLDVVMESQIAKLSSTFSSRTTLNRKDSITEPVEETSETESSSVDATGGRNSYKEAMLMAETVKENEGIHDEPDVVGADQDDQTEESAAGESSEVSASPSKPIGRSLSRAGAKYYTKRRRPPTIQISPPSEENNQKSGNQHGEEAVAAKSGTSPKTERFRRITYDLAMGVISPLEWSSMIEEHEKRASQPVEDPSKSDQNNGEGLLPPGISIINCLTQALIIINLFLILVLKRKHLTVYRRHH